MLLDLYPLLEEEETPPPEPTFPGGVNPWGTLPPTKPPTGHTHRGTGMATVRLMASGTSRIIIDWTAVAFEDDRHIEDGLL